MTAKPPGLGRLRIVSLTAENIKRIVAVHIEPNGSVVQITGKNGHGKSSVLDSSGGRYKERASFSPNRFARAPIPE